MKSLARLLVLLALSITGGFFAGRAWWGLQPPSPTPPLPQLAAADHLPSIGLPDLTGRARTLEEWSSQPLLVNFWATWCAPCRNEMPLLEQLHQERSSSGLAVVGIAMDREEPVRTFVADAGISYPILVGESEAMAAAESVAPGFVGLPLTVIVAPGGDIVRVHMGELHPPDLARIVAVLGELIRGRLTLATARGELDSYFSQRRS